MCEIAKDGKGINITFEVLHGKVELKSFQIGENNPHKFKGTNVIGEGESTAFKYKL